jgi:glycosidase
MAENLAIPGRMSVRAPMQWSNDPNGGFSTAPPDRLRRPVVEGKKWGPAAINVARPAARRGLALNWMERLIRRRRETPEIAFGAWSLVPVPQAAILALRYDWGERTVLVIHNLGQEGEDLLRAGFSIDKRGTVALDLEAYGCRWLRLRRAGGGTPV